uniref:Uncharacterized protein n=1 Tax=Monodelphis domestica TaxID=13616 RepID=A0A5F8H2H4_MONDO
MSSAKSDNLVSSLPILIPSISLSSLIATASVSSTMSNSRGDNGHPCFTPDLIGNASSLSPLQMILAVGFRYILFIIFRNDPSIPMLSSVFNRNGCCILSKAFSTSIEIIMWFLLVCLLMWSIMWMAFSASIEIIMWFLLVCLLMWSIMWMVSVLISFIHSAFCIFSSVNVIVSVTLCICIFVSLSLFLSLSLKLMKLVWFFFTVRLPKCNN